MVVIPRNRPVAFAVSLVLMFAAPTMVQAAIITFENPPGPGHFQWAGLDAPQFLDLTEPAVNQPTYPSRAAGLSQYVVVADNIGVIGGNVNSLVGGTGDLFSIGLDEETLIDGSGIWSASPIVNYADLGGSEIPEGVTTYLAARFDPNGLDGTECTPGHDCHYGWIRVVRTGLELDALAWGYESDVETPIVAGAPEPASLSLLVIGAVGVLGRRRWR